MNVTAATPLPGAPRREIAALGDDIPTNLLAVADEVRE
jgi:hypothetical protein